MPEIKVATKPVSQGAPGSLTLMRGVRTPRGEQALLLKQGVRGAWMLAELRAIFPLEISPYFGNRWAGREQTGNDRFLIQVLPDLGKPAQAWPHTSLILSFPFTTDRPFPSVPNSQDPDVLDRLLLSPQLPGCISSTTSAAFREASRTLTLKILLLLGGDAHHGPARFVSLQVQWDLQEHKVGLQLPVDPRRLCGVKSQWVSWWLETASAASAL